MPLNPSPSSLDGGFFYQMMNLKRLFYPLVLVLLVAGLWFVWPSRHQATPARGGAEKQPTTQPTTDKASAGERGQDSESPVRRPSRVRSQPVSEDGNAAVARILSNDRIGEAEAATLLQELAVDASLPTEDRLEALTHGLNLDITPFASFGSTPALPAELATPFLEAVLNHNEAPQLQIQSYLALLDHSDPEVSALATDMLAFVVGDDLKEASHATLRQMAQRKLAELPPVAEDAK